MKRMLYIDFPNWPIQRWWSLWPERRGGAVGLFAPDARRTDRLIAVSPRAAQGGVTWGMSLAEASTVGGFAPVVTSSETPRDQPPARSAPPLQNTRQGVGQGASRGVGQGAGRGAIPLWLERADEEGDRERLRALAEECEQFTPVVCWGPGEPVTGLGLDIGATVRFFGGEEGLLDAVATWARQLPFSVRLVVADTLAAASALARYTPASDWVPLPWEAPVTAARSGDLANTPAARLGDGRVSGMVVNSAELEQRLASLPVSVLSLSPAIHAVLQELGLRQLGQMSRLGRDAIAARLGPEVLQRWDQLIGVQAEVLAVCPRRVTWRVAQAYEFPLVDWEEVWAAWRALMQPMVQELQELGEGALQLAGELVCWRGERVELEVGFFLPTAQLDHWAEQLRIRAERLTLPGPVEWMEWRVVRRGELNARQLGLWSESEEEWGSGASRYWGSSGSAEREWGEWVTRVSNRLGSERVVRVRSRAAALPEKAWLAQPWTGSAAPRARRSRSRRTAQHWAQPRQAAAPPTAGEALLAPGNDGAASRGEMNRGEMSRSEMNRGGMRRFERELSGERPVWVCEPVLLTSVVLDRQLRQPTSVGWGSESWPVLWAWGPERWDTAWWQSEGVRRDYYRLLLHDGRLVWIVHDRTVQAWYLQGYFL